MVTLKLVIRQHRVGLSGIWVAGNHVHFLIFISYTLILTSAALARSSEELLRRSKWEIIFSLNFHEPETIGLNPKATSDTPDKSWQIMQPYIWRQSSLQMSVWFWSSASVCELWEGSAGWPTEELWKSRNCIGGLMQMTHRLKCDICCATQPALFVCVWRKGWPPLPAG